MARKLPKILIDTREQSPFEFRGLATLRRGLKTGDYTLQGYQKLLCVERKSHSDLFGTLARRDNFARFERELGRMEAFRWAFLVVEDTPEGVVNGFSYSNANGPLVLDKMVRVCCQHGVQPVFGGNKWGAERVTLAIFRAVLKYENR